MAGILLGPPSVWLFRHGMIRMAEPEAENELCPKLSENLTLAEASS